MIKKLSGTYNFLFRKLYGICDKQCKIIILACLKKNTYIYYACVREEIMKAKSGESLSLSLSLSLSNKIPLTSKCMDVKKNCWFIIFREDGIVIVNFNSVQR
jgi:hypothetical protein